MDGSREAVGRYFDDDENAVRMASRGTTATVA